MQQPDHAPSPSLMDVDGIENSDDRQLLIHELPSEVLEQVFHHLSMTDRLTLIRASKLLKGVYDDSATLQYDFQLRVGAYLDVPYDPPPLVTSRDEPARQDDNGWAPKQKVITSYTVPSVVYSPPVKVERKPDDDHSVLHEHHEHEHEHEAQEILVDNIGEAMDGGDEEAKLNGAKFETRDPALPCSALDKADRLARLEDNWRTLNHTVERTFEIKGPAGVYELQEGVFLMCDDYSDVDDGKPLSIRLIPLPSATDPHLHYPPISLRSQKLPFTIADLTMDPTQDLIVVSENHPTAPHGDDHPTHRYHLLQMSTFEPHPLAASPMLDFPPFSQMVSQTRQLLQVMGDVLVILVSRYVAHWILAGVAMGIPGLANAGVEEELVIWNWKTGNVISRLALPENGWFASLALLSPTSFMVTSTSSVSPVMPGESRSFASVFPPVIQLYSFAPEARGHGPPSQPLSASHMDDTTARPILLVQLELPRFAPGATISSFDVRPDPAFPPRKPGPSPRVGGSKPFTQDPTKGLLVFDLQVWEPAEDDEGLERREEVSFEIFVLRETLVEVARQGEERLEQARRNAGPDGWNRAQVEVVIPWEEWGVKGARLMDVSVKRRTWVCSCSGYRFISLIPSDELPIDDDDRHELVPTPAKLSDLRMLDFSPYSVRREQTKMTALKRPRGRGRSAHPHHGISASPMPPHLGGGRSASGSGRRASSVGIGGREAPEYRPWDSIQDIATSSAPVRLSKEDIQRMYARVHGASRGRSGYGRRDASMDGRVDINTEVDLDEATLDEFRRQYDRLFWAAAASRTKSDRADRERGRGRAGGNRAASNSRSRSRSTSVTPLGAGGAHARRSRSARSTSPASIFRATMGPINMSGSALPAGAAVDDDETEFEVRLVLAPTVLEKRRVWREDVVSGLPFREVWRRMERRANGVMLDDQRVIVVRTEGRRGNWNGITQEMTVLCM